MKEYDLKMTIFIYYILCIVSTQRALLGTRLSIHKNRNENELVSGNEPSLNPQSAPFPLESNRVYIWFITYLPKLVIKKVAWFCKFENLRYVMLRTALSYSCLSTKYFYHSCMIYELKVWTSEWKLYVWFLLTPGVCINSSDKSSILLSETESNKCFILTAWIKLFWWFSGMPNQIQLKRKQTKKKIIWQI